MLRKHMATISKEHYPEKALTIFTIVGSAGREEILQVVDNLTDEERTPNIIWDATDGTVGGMHYRDIKYIAEKIRGGHGSRADGRTGLVAGTALDYGMARMFATYASIKGLSVRYKCFRALGDAVDWIDQMNRSHHKD
jgi:hypothetical protein